MRPVLDVDSLRICNGAKELVQGVGFSVGPGEIVGLVGESGSGKSLTALAIIQLLPSALRAEGNIRLCGEPVLGVRDDRMRQLRGREVSIVFQNPSSALNPALRIGAQLGEVVGRRARGDVKAACAELLESLRVRDARRLLTMYPHQLSGGLRQRILLAMALAPRPRLLIADEATTALDTVTQAQVCALLRAAARERRTGLLFITHDLALASGLCDRISVMHQGRIVESGPAQRILSSPEDDYTRRLLAAHPDRGAPKSRFGLALDKANEA